jgi:hypothetical protein
MSDDDFRFWATALIIARLERELEKSRTGPLRRQLQRGWKPGDVIEVRGTGNPHTPILRGACCPDKDALLASTHHYADPTA